MTLTTGRHGVFETLPGDSVVADSLRWYGEWAENELDLLRRFIGTGSVIADVGAFIGTHSVALARAAGPVGKVLAFEPRRVTFSLLERNIDRNGLAQIEALNVGVSDEAGSIQLNDPVDGTHNLGSLALVDEGEGYAVSIITLDSLALTRLDLIKIDVEGMEAQVIAGAAATMRRCRPVVFAECNSVDGAAATLAAAQPLDYVAFGAVYPAFNPRNYNGCADNFFGDNAECALFLIPRERVALSQVDDMRRIESLEDVVALMLEKPQYLPEMLPEAPGVPSVVRAARHARAASVSMPRRALHVVAPFYQNEQLVAPFMESLRSVAAELIAARATLWIYNDSPGHAGLEAALAMAVEQGIRGVAIHLIANSTNEGFIGTCNRAFATAIEDDADVLLLNSDTQVMPGAIEEILAVSDLDPMFGFICPRSNNATLASLPHSSEQLDLTPAEAFERFLPLARRLPRFNLAPTAVGFALWIRGPLLAEFGLFDTVYGKGYNEENDLIMRANRAGYRAVLANHAFVWHQGEQSFSTTSQQRSERDLHNAAILRSRYPEYSTLVDQYYRSPEYRAEKLLEALEPEDGRRVIAFDFSSFGSFHNGTFESGVKLLSAAVRSWPQDVRVAVVISQAAWSFHGLDRVTGLLRLEPGDKHAALAAIVRIGQPYQPHELARLFEAAPVVGIFMLDTISTDCGYLSLDFDVAVWRFAFKHTSTLFTNSAFTLDRIRNRYAIGKHTIQYVSRHSLDPADYARPPQDTVAGGKHVLVIGNHYAHKFVKATADALAKALPDTQIVAIGYAEDAQQPSNIVAYQAGNIAEEMFVGFYRDASTVVFPSHYEGFGFPILHALAHHRPVFARDTALNRELASGIGAAPNIHLYETTSRLVDALTAGIPEWNASHPAGEVDGWTRSALEVHAALAESMRSIDAPRVADVLRELDAILKPAERTASEMTSGQRVGLRLGRVIDRLLQLPGMSRAARALAGLYRKHRI